MNFAGGMGKVLEREERERENMKLGRPKNNRVLPFFTLQRFSSGFG